MCREVQKRKKNADRLLDLWRRSPRSALEVPPKPEPRKVLVKYLRRVLDK